MGQNVVSVKDLQIVGKLQHVNVNVNVNINDNYAAAIVEVWQKTIHSLHLQPCTELIHPRIVC